MTGILYVIQHHLDTGQSSTLFSLEGCHVDDQILKEFQNTDSRVRQALGLSPGFTTY